jgi:hypothetical protein
MIEWLLLTLLIVHVVGFWLLVFRVIRLRRQIRCLHYCFVSISDWGIESVKEVVNYYIEQDGRDNSPFLDLEENWGNRAHRWESTPPPTRPFPKVFCSDSSEKLPLLRS